jgi:L-ascorbate metabolism protein UlaG (beta-lactamase superfamily)
MKKKRLFRIMILFFFLTGTISVQDFAAGIRQEKQDAIPKQTKAYVFTEKAFEYKEIADRDLESAVQIYFLGNCGYLISGGGKSMLVDALYKHPHPQFPDCRTPEDAYEKMLNLEQPFQKIELLLVSHYHPDHFTPDRGFPFLLKHPETRMIANEFAISLAKEKDPENYEKVKHQIISQTPEWGMVQEVSVNGCSLKLYLVKHTTDAHLDKEYIVTQFLIEIEGLKILHMGDMHTPSNMEYFKKFGLEKENIDIVFHTGIDLNNRKILMNEFVKPKLFVVMHNDINDEGSYYRSFLKTYPNTTIFLEPMEKKFFVKSKK